MDSIEDYARRWAKHEDEDPDTLSEWLKNYTMVDKIANLQT